MELRSQITSLAFGSPRHMPNCSSLDSSTNCSLCAMPCTGALRSSSEDKRHGPGPVDPLQPFQIQTTIPETPTSTQPSALVALAIPASSVPTPCGLWSSPAPPLGLPTTAGWLRAAHCFKACQQALGRPPQPGIVSDCHPSPPAVPCRRLAAAEFSGYCSASPRPTHPLSAWPLG